MQIFITHELSPEILSFLSSGRWATSTGSASVDSRTYDDVYESIAVRTYSLRNL